MQKINKKRFSNETLQKLLIVVLIIALFFKIFSIMIVPEPAYNDSVYHLELVKSFMNGVQITKETPPFAYHLLLAGFFKITNLPIEWPFLKISPLLIFAAQTIIAIMLFRKIFPKNFLIPTIFFTVFPWAVRTGSVNMVDSFAILVALLTLFFIHAMYKEENRKKFWTYTVLACASFMLISFTKANLLFISPAFVLAFAFVLWKKTGKIKAIGLTILALILLSSFIFVSISAPESQTGFNNANSIRELPIPQLDSIRLLFVPKSIATFFDLPPQTFFNKLPILKNAPYYEILATFILLLLPIVIAIIWGTWKHLRKIMEEVKKIFKKMNNEELDYWFIIFCIVGALVSIYPTLSIIREQSIYMRYLLPGLPFFAIIFCKGYEQLKGKMKIVILASLLIFCIYSFAMTSASGLFYKNIEEKNMPAYDFIKSNKDINLLVSMFNTRALRYYTGKNAIEIPYQKISSEEFIKKFGKENTFVPTLCYNEEIPEVLDWIKDKNKTQLVFESDCTKVYQIK